MIVDSDRLDAHRVRTFIAISERVVAANGNVRGVRPVNVVTHSLETAKFHGVKVREKDGENLGMWYPAPPHQSTTGDTVRGAVIWLRDNRGYDELVDTLTHEVAHGCSQGAHGFTWRRMYTLLTPFAMNIFHDLTPANADDFQMIVEGRAQRVISRYATRYVHTSVWDTTSAYEKKEAEARKHTRAAWKMWNNLQHLVK